jgi:predicted dehydrogenase
MTERLRIGVLGLTHDHIWHHTDDLAASDAVEVVAVASEHEDLLEKFEAAVPVTARYSSAEQALEQAQLDVVMVYDDNRRSVDLAIAALRVGIHAVVEKPIAATLDQADELLAEARKADAQLVVNWPIAWYPAFRHAITLARSGRIGEVNHVEYRAAHMGPKEYGCSEYFYEWLYDPQRNGGGVLADYACYGALAAHLLLGPPHRVYATAGRYQKDYIDVEDNAVVIMEYPCAHAIAQASWSQIGPGTGQNPVIYGTTGTILVHQRSGSKEGHVIKEGAIELMTREKPDGVIIEPPALPAGERTLTEHLVSCLRDGAPLNEIVAPAISRDVQETLTAAYEAVGSGTRVALPLQRVGSGVRGAAHG